MGSNSSKTGQITVSLNHPKLQTVSLSSDKKQMAFSIVIDEVVYKDWKKKLSDSKNDPEYLFLPLTY